MNEEQEKIIDHVPEADKELDDIQENEVKYDSDGVARGSSPGRPPSRTSSMGSVGSNGSRGSSKGKRRSWKKPKDKPKRPLSAYNLFFKHERSRIVEGKTEEATPDEVIRSIEGILSTSRETRKHRKTHGRISFGDLARKIAEKWKSIEPKAKAVFEHYAELDMRRYRKEVKLWQEKKEMEAHSGLKQGSIHDGMNNSLSSSLHSESEFSLDQLNSQHSNDAWASRNNFYDSMNSSISSSCSIDSEVSLEPLPIGNMLRQARPNMNVGMPNLGPNVDQGIPGFVQGYFQTTSNSQQMDRPLQQVGLQALGNLQLGVQQGVQMDPSSLSINASFSRMQNHLQQQQSLEEQRQHLLLQQQLLQQQQQALQLRIQQQQDSMNQQPSMNQQLSMNQQGLQINEPIPFSEVFSNGTVTGDGDHLENFLSNLDLSND